MTKFEAAVDACLKTHELHEQFKADGTDLLVEHANVVGALREKAVRTAILYEVARRGINPGTVVFRVFSPGYDRLQDPRHGNAKDATPVYNTVTLTDGTVVVFKPVPQPGSNVPIECILGSLATSKTSWARGHIQRAARAALGFVPVISFQQGRWVVEEHRDLGRYGKPLGRTDKPCRWESRDTPDGVDFYPII